MSKKFNWMPIGKKGKWFDKNQQEVELDEKFFDEIVAATPDPSQVNFVIEHPNYDKIGFGKPGILKRVGEFFLALPKEVNEDFKKAVNNGDLPGRSMTIDKATKRLLNISFLPPTVPPAVSGLGAYSFSKADDDKLTYVFSLPGIESHFADLPENETDRIEFAQYEVSGYPFRLIKDAMNGLRDFIIDKFDLDTANKTLPKWMLESLGNPPRIIEKPDRVITANEFSFQPKADPAKRENILQLQNGDNKMDLSKFNLSKADPDVRAALEALNNENTTLTTNLAARDVELQAATTKLTEAERVTLRNEVLQFCESDDVKLKIKPAVKEKVVNFLMAQKEVAKNGVIEFSSADKNGTATKVEFNAFEFAQEIVKMLPDVIELGELATKEKAGEQSGLADYQKVAKDIADSVNR